MDTTTHDDKRVVRTIPGRNGGTLTPITSATAHDMLRKREEKRMRLYAEGAQLAVQDVALIRQYGQDAHLVERARTMQEIATTPDAGKAAVLAAAHLDKAQGYDMGKQAQSGGQVAGLLDSVDVDILLIALTRRGDVIDAEAVDVGTDDGGDGG